MLRRKPGKSMLAKEYQPKENGAHESKSGRFDVLGIEDNADHQHLIERLLRDSFPTTEVRFADRITKALSQLADRKFDLIISDLTLPDAIGVDAVEILRKVADVTPIVVLTANANEHVATEALRAGAEEYLSKDELDRGS